MADKKEDKPTKRPASRFALKGRRAIESTHPHAPRVAWCKKCQR